MLAPSLLHLFWLYALLPLVTAFLAFRGARAMQLRGEKPHSLPRYHAMASGLWVLVSMLAVGLACQLAALWGVDAYVMGAIPDEVKSDAGKLALWLDRLGHAGVDWAQEWEQVAHQRWVKAHAYAAWVHSMLISIAGVWAWLAVSARWKPEWKARVWLENLFLRLLMLASAMAVVVTLAIVVSILVEAVQFFFRVSPLEFLTGLQWSPQMAMRADQAGSSGAFGAVPLFWGTLFITLIAMSVAAPVGLMSAVYLTQYASARARAWLKPMLELLAGVPTVVYGYFAAVAIGPSLKTFGSVLGLDVAAESALAAGAVMGVMIIPFVSSLADDVIHSVPRTLSDGSLALGATPSETIRRVILPAATPGIIGALLLAVSRAIGETMIVVMAAGLAANMTANPLEAVTTVTAQIVSLLVGDQEFDSPKTLAAFALGLVLFVMTLAMNFYALRIVKSYRARYA